MSNPDATAGPYAGNEKKPIGGNIIAHASTTRYVFNHPALNQLKSLLVGCNLRNLEVIHDPARSTIPRVSQKWRHISLFLPAGLVILRRKHNTMVQYDYCVTLVAQLFLVMTLL
jgi:Rad51